MQVLAQRGPAEREWMTEKRGLGSGAGSATSMQEREGLAQTRRVDFAAAFVLGERHSVSAAPGNGAPTHLIIWRLTPGCWRLTCVEPGDQPC